MRHNKVRKFPFKLHENIVLQYILYFSLHDKLRIAVTLFSQIVGLHFFKNHERKLDKFKHPRSLRPSNILATSPILG